MKRKKVVKRELERVRLQKDLPKYGLKKGQEGIIVLIYEKAKEIEFGCENKDKKMLITLPIKLVK